MGNFSLWLFKRRRCPSLSGLWRFLGGTFQTNSLSLSHSITHTHGHSSHVLKWVCGAHMCVWTQVVCVCWCVWTLLQLIKNSFSKTCHKNASFMYVHVLRMCVCVCVCVNVSFERSRQPLLGCCARQWQRQGQRGWGRGKARLRAALAAHKEFFFNLAVKQRATIAPKSWAAVNHRIIQTNKQTYIHTYIHTYCNCVTY